MSLHLSPLAFLLAALACGHPDDRIARPADTGTGSESETTKTLPSVAPLGSTLDRTGLDTLRGTTFQHADVITDTTADMGGWLLHTARGGFSRNFAVARQRMSGREYLTLGAFVDEAGNRIRWRILDAVWIPDQADSLMFVSGCSYDDNPDHGLMGMAVPDDAEWFTRVRQAWRADSTVGRFVPISTAGLRCSNVAWGI